MKGAWRHGSLTAAWFSLRWHGVIAEALATVVPRITNYPIHELLTSTQTGSRCVTALTAEASARLIQSPTSQIQYLRSSIAIINVGLTLEFNFCSR